MRSLLIMALLSRMAAQTPAKPEAPAPAPAATEQKPASPVVSSEAWFTGSIDVGYRWRTDVAGSLNAYRSVVDLGEGPKLLDAEFTILDPKKRLFDRIEARGDNWGDDPNATLHVNARKARLYDVNADYRNIAYFNALPSFADPLLARGIFLNERSFDIRRRMSSFELDLLPGNWIVPYLAYDRNSGSGNGITTFVTDGNEYPLPDRIRDRTSSYRGGVRLELRRFHVTLEQGGTTFRDDQQVFSSSGPRNPGNNSVPVFGQSLFLSSLQQEYGIRGSSIYSKALFTASPASWADVYGQFLYSQPKNDVHYQQFDTGSLAVLSQALLYTGQQYLLSAQANLPHTSGSLGADVRPFRRLRIVESWLTDRLHNAGSSQASQILTPASAAPPQPLPQSARLVSNYSQEQVDAFFDVSRRLTLRGGYRYVWGDGSTQVLPVAGLLTPDAGKLRRNVGIGGFSFRPNQKMVVNGEVESASSDHSYFRTSLNDYKRIHARARYQALGSLSVSADFSLLDNQNPATGIQYDYLARQNSVSFLWSPQGGKRFSLHGDYTRSTMRSDISYLIPQELRSARSFYRDNAHVSSAILDVALPGYRKLAPKLSLGGAFLISSGSRPTSYYQPLTKLFVPISAHVAWVSDWRYYGFGEAFYSYEGFRTHLITTGLRLTR
jgi:hypothetical protein